MSISQSSQPPRGMFERLPVEVVTLVAIEVNDADFKSLCSLRLVCRVLNAVAGPFAFASLSLRNGTQTDEDTGMGLIERLRLLKTGFTPYSRWAQTLMIEQGGLFLIIERSHSYEKRIQKALEDRKDFLVPAVASLSNLKYAKFRMERHDPYEDVLHALSGLPKLTELSLGFGWDLESPPAALAQFSNLQILHLAGWRLFPCFLDAIQGMLARSSSCLEDITLLPYVCPSGRWQWLDDNPATGESRNVPFQRVIADTIFPSLKKMVVDASGIKLNGRSGTTFRTLTHLEIRFGAQENVSAAFWQSLENAEVRLEALSVFPVTKSVSNYLASYSGLRTLRLCHAPGELAPPPPNEDIDATAHNVFDAILPKHSHTLRHLAFEGIKFDAFVLGEHNLRMLLGCLGLEKLWMVYNPPGGRPYDTAHPDLVRMISRLVSTLPRLYELTMQSAIRNYHRPVPPGSISAPVASPRHPSGRYKATNRRPTPLKAAMKKGFWESVREAEGELKVALLEEPGEAVSLNEAVPRQFEVRRSVWVEWRA